MKLRLIIIIFSVILVTVTGITLLHFYFFRNERLRLIDRQIETSASILVSSDLSNVPLSDLEQTEDYFYETLGIYKSNRFILLRDLSGKILYSSRNAEWLPENPPANGPKWQTLSFEDHRVRLLTLQMPKINRTLQIGMLLDHELLHWHQLDTQFFFYSGVLVLLILGSTFFLAHLLLRPLRNLAAYLEYLAGHFETGVSDPIPSFKSPRWIPGSKPDEFDKLAVAVTRLADQVRVNTRIFRAWTAQLAHEMKTPLTVLRNCLESFARPGKDKAENAAVTQEALAEVTALNQTIDSFLSWVSVENSPETKDGLCAISVSEIVTQVSQRLSKMYPNRVDLKIEEDIKTFANPQYLEQAISNLVLNGLKYSGDKAPVTISVGGGQIIVEDSGGEFPSVVLQKLGEPFNSSPENKSGKRGTGLGLAWVSAICKKYDWNFRIESFKHSTMAIIEGFEAR